MSKKSKQKLRGLTIGAMMAALSIVLERVISPMPASNMMDIRISLSNVPIILAGILASPVVGALCGVVSDIVGCFISGYAPFPLLTAAPLVMGFLPGFLLGCFPDGRIKYSFVKVLIAVVISHILSSIIITTFGLSVMRGVPFVPMLVTRLPSCAVNLVIDVVLVYFLLKAPVSKKI